MAVEPASELAPLQLQLATLHGPAPLVLPPPRRRGAGQYQIMKIEGYYAYADVRNIEFANGRQDQATVGVFGGAGAAQGLG